MESELIDLIEVIKAQRGSYTNKASQDLDKEVEKQTYKGESTMRYEYIKDFSIDMPTVRSKQDDKIFTFTLKIIADDSKRKAGKSLCDYNLMQKLKEDITNILNNN